MWNLSNLPPDILLEILTRLPTESCKAWRQLVSHYPSFSQLQLDHLNDLDSGKLSFIFYIQGMQKDPFYYTEYDENLNCFSKPPLDDCRILDSCHGLICFNGPHAEIYLGYEPGYIFNPITKEYVILPKPETNGVLTGFGYNPTTNEYKVVRSYISRRDLLFQVYTLGSGAGWRSVRKKDSNLWRCVGVFVGGAIYWVSCKGTILAFDLADEEFREFPLPDYSPRWNVTLHVLGDLLCGHYHHPGGFDLPVLKKNTNNPEVIWSKEFNNKKPISFTRSGGLLCYDYSDKNVYLYSPEASSSKMLVNFDKDFNVGVLRHTNTLVSLKALAEEDTKLMDTGERARSSRETETESNSH